jgi:hypothetical protein
VKEGFELVESSARIGCWRDSDKIQITILKITEVAKAFYSSNPELHNTGISWENFKANFLHRFRDVRNDHYHFMQLQTAKQKKEGKPQEYLDRCRSLAMKTVPKVNEPLLQKVHYNQAQRMLLSTFIARVYGNPGQQIRFQMPATVDQALQIANTVFQAEEQEKRNLAFFRIPKPTEKVEATLVNPGRPLEDQSTDRQRQQNANPTNTSCEGKLPCLKCGKQGQFASVF